MEFIKIVDELKLCYLICFEAKVLVIFKKKSCGIISKPAGHYVTMYQN